jgi:integrase
MADIEPSISSGSTQLSEHKKELCVYCRCCETEHLDLEGKPCCIFCEDGEPCPNRRGTVRPGGTRSVSRAAQRPQTPSEAQTSGQAPNASQREPTRVYATSSETPRSDKSRPTGKRSSDPLRDTAFGRAAEAWLESRRPFLAPKTMHEYGMNIRTLAAFFGKVQLPEITADHIRAYQRARMASCGPSAINHETSCLQQILKRIGRWPEIAADFQPLPLPKTNRGRALSPEEYERLFRTAPQSAEWLAAYLFAVISVNTTAGPKEVATLRLGDVELTPNDEKIRIQPEGAKNSYRVRVIPLNEQTLTAVKAALDRAHECGSNKVDHYLFPFREKRNHYDPTRHQTTFKTAWREMIAAAGISGLRMYDLRHHAITTLLEDPDASEETVETIAGHISHRMKKRYSHVRMQAKRAALAVLVRGQSRHLPIVPKSERMRNQDVLALLGAGLSPEIVVGKIKASACEFDTSTQVLQELKAAAVPDRVILAMLKQRS